MTFILAANLSDRIYLAADSLVTRPVGDKKETAGYTLKLLNIASTKSMQEAGSKSPEELSNHGIPSISCLFSGNRLFAHFIFVALNNGLDSGELSDDINELLEQIDPYLKKMVPKYQGSSAGRICKIIIAGCSNSPNSVKAFNLDNLHSALGPTAGHIDDPNAVQGIQHGFINVPDQKIFSYIIDERDGSFGLGEVGGMYSVITGGSKKLTKDEEAELLRYFLSKRNPEVEGMSIVNYIRNQFSDSIGGAVTLGYIDKRKRLIYFGYDINKSANPHNSDWSFRIENLPDKTRFMAQGPQGQEYDLIRGFYDFPGDFTGQDLEM